MVYTLHGRKIAVSILEDGTTLDRGPVESGKTGFCFSSSLKYLNKAISLGHVSHTGHSHCVKFYERKLFLWFAKTCKNFAVRKIPATLYIMHKTHHSMSKKPYNNFAICTKYMYLPSVLEWPPQLTSQKWHLQWSKNKRESENSYTHTWGQYLCPSHVYHQFMV